MLGLLPIILAASHLVLAADKVPELNSEPSCRAATNAEISISANRDEKACLRDESNAHDKLQAQWGQYTAQQRSTCLSMSSTGGYPSYVEVLTCLEMSKAAAELPAESKMNGSIKR
jgi:hypothetical protein